MIANLYPERMSEAQLDDAIREMCRQMSLHRYHTYDSRRSEAGFPDLTIVGASVIFRELKRESGTVTPSQRVWLARLEAAGADVGVWRPSDLASKRIAQELFECKFGRKP